MGIIKTNLILKCTCKNCGATYMAVAIYGGIEIDAESTRTIAEAHLRGDKVELVGGGVTLRMCNCENDKKINKNNMETMKLFLVDQCAYVAAYSEEQAIEICRDQMGFDEECEAVEIPREKIKDIKIYDTDFMDEDSDEECPLFDLYGAFIISEEEKSPEVLAEIEP